MNPSDTGSATVEKAEQKPAVKYATREDWLSCAGKLNEEERTITGLGEMLLGEIGADVRAEIMTEQQSIALFAEGAAKKIDRKWYEKKLLLAGVLDPNSPAGARTPLFRQGDLDSVMRIGGAKIAEVVDAIERLSLMGRYMPSAEGNSNGSPNSAGG